MSQLMNKLNSLNKTRRVDKGIVIEEAQETQEDQETQEKVQVVSQHKGIYFLSFLMVLLIGFSVFSTSISLKTFSQLEETRAGSKAILKTLSEQQKDIVALRLLIADSTSKELVKIEDVGDQVKELKVAIKNREDEISDMKVAYNSLKESIQGSIEELEFSDKLILSKYILLNDQVKKLNDENLWIFNTY